QTVSRKYCRTIREVFENVSNSKVAFGLVPLENKLAGSVHETYDAFWEYENVKGVLEIKLPICHVLAAKKNISIKEIDKVYSHPQPLSQCSKFLEKHRYIKRVASSSTAEAVTLLSGNSAAILPEKAAEKFHLNIIKKDITNSADNYTRFCIILKEGGIIPKEIIKPSKKRTALRTSMAFELLKTKAGSLLGILQFFANENINLLKLESKPVGDKGDTIFFVDIEGEILRNQLIKLKEKVAVLKVFGSMCNL
ncbi:hypothetical protein HON22_05000, partial [Candidatus Peregrinibacteria bacterium]|nr:hypothetical protein [Candidatus Peregrinibacteria bacterium]